MQNRLNKLRRNRKMSIITITDIIIGSDSELFNTLG